MTTAEAGKIHTFKKAKVDSNLELSRRDPSSTILGPFPHQRTNTSKKSHATIGRYVYLGSVPKFEAHQVEMTISKMSLTNRVTAWVKQDLIDQYAKQLYLRWKLIDDAIQDPKFVVDPLLNDEAFNVKNEHEAAWMQIANQYMDHILEKKSPSLFLDIRSSEKLSSSEQNEYKQKLSHGVLKYFYNDSGIDHDEFRNNSNYRSKYLSKQSGNNLFNFHLGSNFSKTNKKNDYVGFLTFVYPIAATVKGPFDQPKEQVTDLKTVESIEARWWSDKWDDEFGGMPFILIEYSGVAFHGPITNYRPQEIWYLRRGYVSHGCHRMDSSDLLELRAMMPHSLKSAAKKVKITILNYFDVVDSDLDGVDEVVDVKFYNIPSSTWVPKSKSVDDYIKPWLIENQMKNFFKNNIYSAKFFDQATDSMLKIPKYDLSGSKPVVKGVHEKVQIKHFDYRPSRIIQYDEEGVKRYGYDDSAGKYPPKYFMQY